MVEYARARRAGPARTGFIGLGTMGAPLATRLLDAGDIGEVFWVVEPIGDVSTATAEPVTAAVAAASAPLAPAAG